MFFKDSKEPDTTDLLKQIGEAMGRADSSQAVGAPLAQLMNAISEEDFQTLLDNSQTCEFLMHALQAIHDDHFDDFQNGLVGEAAENLILLQDKIDSGPPENEKKPNSFEDKGPGPGSFSP